MTVDAARRPRRRTTSAKADPEPTIAPPASIVIGELEQTIFECPSCSRPLALGARRCPGCGTHLIRGVTITKASGFVAVGLAVGLLSGFGGAVVLGLSHAPVAPAAAGGLPSAPPVAGTNGGSGSSRPAAPTATPASPTSTAPTGIPPVTGSALTQVIGTNDRLAADRTALKAALAASSFDPSEVAQILRTISADSIFGQQVAGRLAGWSGSSAVGSQLATFYGSVHAAAAEGLVASVRNGAAYRTAARTMVRLLDDLPAIDAAVREVAASAGLDLGASRPSTAP
jgi:hypothetical protein